MFTITGTTISHSSTRRRRNARYERGGIYIAVLGASAIVMTIGLAAITSSRIQLKSAAGNQDISINLTHAQSAANLALSTFQKSDGWRTSLTNNVWSNVYNIDGLQFKIKVVDEIDGKLSNNTTDPARLYVRSVQGNSTYLISVQIQVPETRPAAALGSVIHAGTSLNVGSATVLADRPLSSGTSIKLTTSTIDTDVETAGSVSGSAVVGTTTSNARAKQLPDKAALFAHFTSIATAINIADITRGPEGYPQISDVLISSKSNPYGAATNTNGVYVINCGGERLKISRSRIVGTLVLINAASDSYVSDAVNWNPAVENYPALIVNGDFTSSFQSDWTLKEITTNFNPIGTPYEGVEDSKNNNTYPSVIKGLIYIAGDLSIAALSRFEGIIVTTGSVTISANVEMVYQDVYFADPPIGFASQLSGMRPVPGTWRREME